METKEVKKYYEQAVGESINSYEYNRWEKNSQKKASYKATAAAVKKYACRYLPRSGDVLEFGPGPGTWTKMLLSEAPRLNFDIVDISEEMLKQARVTLQGMENVNFINSDILDFLPSKKYDYFFSSRIIEYVPDKSKAISIVSNSLKPGAYGYIVTKNPHPERFWARKKTSFHSHQVAASDLQKLLKKHNCEIIHVVSVTSVFPGLKNGFLDRVLTIAVAYFPFAMSKYVSESYAIIFQKK